MSTLFDLPFEDEGARAQPEGVPAPARRVFTVSELTAEIRELLEGRYPRIWIEGEISNCRLWHTGHLYFTLKDSGAQIKAVMFKSARRTLKFAPEDGLRVLVLGQVTVYGPKGEYQIACDHMEPHGLGALQLAFEQLKKRLEAEGLFDAARKRPLPMLPRKIGIVTSLDGAAIRDIITVLARRYPNAHLVVRPARVQGEGAAEDVARGLAAVGAVAGVDVVIAGRGGGSAEDLRAFNEEIVARAIAACPVPVISAVGHETDVTIADWVADLRAPTPSAAAEMVVARRDEFRLHIDRLADRLGAAARGRVVGLRGRVHQLAGRPGLAGWPVRLALRGRHAAELTHELRRAASALVARHERQYHALHLRLEARDLRRRFGLARGRITSASGRLASAMAGARHRAELQVRGLAGRLDSLSPLAVLARGYAVCWNHDRTQVVRDAAQTRPGDVVRVTLHRGELQCEVTDAGARYPED